MSFSVADTVAHAGDRAQRGAVAAPRAPFELLAQIYYTGTQIS